ncbi:hypothetical protein JET14_01650 [Martelella lutilitoris]|uniref:DUF3329 domain-containing protein n=1 Tax=Martelella lutilitoris TaxID=2583532 RepID=A0A7T7KLP6_9HYPH|nr:hypothetical protein [Martelella lutilitoris]QQM30920.1 hypothetical protein JET14_01650 [Martelella lutilitoris]
MAGKIDWRESFNLKHPSLKPLWVRILAVALCGGWAVAEIFIGSPFWSILFGAAAAYMAYVFFISPDRAYFNSHDDKPEE